MVKKISCQKITHNPLSKLSTIAAIFFFSFALHINAQGDVVGKVIVGYQGWFDCKGSGSPRDAWVHWGGNPPSPVKLTFEVYPDVREYTNIYQTGFANLANGQPAKLFASWDAQTINVHVRWMSEYGIDGAAIQRFVGSISPGSSVKKWRDEISTKFKNASEQYGVKFYIMYDISGGGDNFDEKIKTDWDNTITDSLDLIHCILLP